MPLTAAEKIRIVLKRRKMKIGDLAEGLGYSRQNLADKLWRDNFKEKDLTKIAEKLNCTYEGTFKLNDTGETI